MGITIRKGNTGKNARNIQPGLFDEQVSELGITLDRRKEFRKTSVENAKERLEELRMELNKTNPYLDKRKNPVYAPAADLYVPGLEKRSERIGKHIEEFDKIMQNIQDYSILRKGSQDQQEAHKYLLGRLEYMWQLLANGKLKEFITAYEDMKLVAKFEPYLPKNIVMASEKMLQDKKLSRLVGSIQFTMDMYCAE